MHCGGQILWRLLVGLLCNDNCAMIGSSYKGNGMFSSVQQTLVGEVCEPLGWLQRRLVRLPLSFVSQKIIVSM